MAKAKLGKLQQFVRVTSTSVDQLQDSPTANVKLIVDSVSHLFEELLVEYADQEPAWDGLAEALVDLRDLTKKLSARVEELEDEHEELKRKISDLEKRFQELQEDEQRLITGQLAFAVDQAVMNRVLKDIGVSGRSIFSIGDMEKAISSEEYYEDVFTDEEKKFAEQRWNELKAQLGWKGKHYRCVKELKSPRLRGEVDVEKMQQALTKLSLQPAMKAVCMEFLDMLKQL